MLNKPTDNTLLTSHEILFQVINKFITCGQTTRALETIDVIKNHTMDFKNKLSNDLFSDIIKINIDGINYLNTNDRISESISNGLEQIKLIK